jgi:hypothetical protein
MTVVLISFIPGRVLFDNPALESCFKVLFWSPVLKGDNKANCGIDSFRVESRTRNGRNTSITFTNSSNREDMLKWVKSHVLRLSQNMTVSPMMPPWRRYVPIVPVSHSSRSPVSVPRVPVPHSPHQCLPRLILVLSHPSGLRQKT